MMNNIEKSFFKIITGLEYERAYETNMPTFVGRAKACASKYEKGLREAYESGIIDARAYPQFTKVSQFNKAFLNYLKP